MRFPFRLLSRAVRRAGLAFSLAVLLALPALPDMQVHAGNNAWSVVNQDPDLSAITSVAFKPGNPKVIYMAGTVAVASTRIYKSTDGGVTWGFASTPVYTGSVYALAVPPKEPATVFAATGSGIFKSTDDGNSWARANTGLPVFSTADPDPLGVLALAVDPQSAGVVYAGTLGDGVYKSTNGGASWSKSGAALTEQVVTVVTVDPSRPSTLYASAINSQGISAIYRSQDAGATWSVIDAGTTDFVAGIAVHPTDSNKIYVGLYISSTSGRVLRTSDGGQTWGSSTLPSGVRSLAIHPTHPSNLWVSTAQAGVHRSTDGGATWSPASTGLMPPPTVVPTTPAATTGGPQLTSPADGSLMPTNTVPAFTFQLPAGHTANIVFVRAAHENAIGYFYTGGVAATARTSRPASTTVMPSGTKFAWQVRSGTTVPTSCSGQNASLWACANDPGWEATSRIFTFTTSGTPALYGYDLVVNPEAPNVIWLGTQGSGLNSYTDTSMTTPVTVPPTLAGPANSSTLSGLGTTLNWTNPPGTVQYQIQVMPANNDGPAMNLIRNAESSFTIQPPVFGVGPYEMLPGMSYTWRVRVTSASRSLTENDSDWGPWSETRTFRTPARDSSKLMPVSPADSASVPAGPQILQWDNGDKDVFYYEVQVSGDTRFDPDPATATSFVWWNLVHGGVTATPNSWVSPALEPGQTVYWRVRPRIQGDGTPAAWGPVWKFTTQ